MKNSINAAKDSIKGIFEELLANVVDINDILSLRNEISGVEDVLENIAIRTKRIVIESTEKEVDLIISATEKELPINVIAKKSISFEKMHNELPIEHTTEEYWLFFEQVKNIITTTINDLPSGSKIYCSVECNDHRDCRRCGCDSDYRRISMSHFVEDIIRNDEKHVWVIAECYKSKKYSFPWTTGGWSYSY
jgi:hypothetical protein